MGKDKLCVLDKEGKGESIKEIFWGKEAMNVGDVGI